MLYSHTKRWLVALLALCVLGCPEAPPPPPVFDRDPAARGELQRLVAEQARLKILTPASREALKSLYDRFPHAAQVRRLLQRDHLARRDFRSLIALIDATPTTERNFDDQLLLAHALTSNRNHQRALDQVLLLLRQFPNQGALRWLAGYNAFQVGDHEQAAQHFDAGWDAILADGYSEALSMRALIHLEAGELDRAETLVSRAVEARPKDIAARHAKVRILRALGREVEAEQVQAELDELRAEADAETKRQHLAISLMRAIQEAWQEERYPEVEALIHQALPIVPSAQKLQLFELMVTVFNATGRPSDAQEMQRRLDALERRRSAGDP